MNAKRITVLTLLAILLFGVVATASASGGPETVAIFSGQVFDGPGGPPVAAAVHLDCNDGTHIDTMSAADGWYSIVTANDPAVWCNLWATDGDLSSGIYGYAKDGWVRQDLTLMWYFPKTYDNLFPRKELSR